MCVGVVEETCLCVLVGLKRMYPVKPGVERKLKWFCCFFVFSVFFFRNSLVKIFRLIFKK